MSKTLKLNARASGRRGQPVRAHEADSQAFEQLKAELQRAFAGSDASYQKLDADAVIRRSRSVK